MSEWLETVKSGDVVVVNAYGLSLAKVDRITPTQIVVGHSKYRRSNGRLVGGSAWHSTYLVEPTPERLLKIKRESIVGYLHHTNWSAMPDETLFEVANRVEQAVEVLKAAKA